MNIANEILSQSFVKTAQNENVYQDMSNYLSGELKKLKERGLDKVICSTDVIESFFGKYKQSSLKAANINAHCMRIFAYGKRIDGSQ